MPTVLGANSASDAYEVANSMRFNNDDSAYMQFTPGSASGNRKKWTWSGWIKRGHPALDANNDYHRFFCVDADINNYIITGFNVSGAFNVTARVGNTEVLKFETPGRMFRDHSAWYHIVMAYDSTQGTARNRFRVYFNGVEDDRTLDTTPSQNQELTVLDTSEHNIGRDNHSNTTYYYDGYMAEVVWIDGSQEAVTSFGEFDEDSPQIWKPIDVSGLTFGNNGFYLDFEDSANLGNDVNGGTDWTENNFAATDQSTDTCTNNFCTLSPLYNVDGSYTLSEGNTEFLGTGGNDHTLGTLGVQGSGKWYFEAEFDTNSAAAYAGFADSDLANNLASDAAGVTVFIGMYRDDHTMQIGGGNEGAYTDVSDGDIFGFAMNLDANSGSKTVIVQKNGSTIDTVTIPTANEDNIFIPIVGDTSGTDARLKLNCGGMPNPTPSSGVADAKGHGSFEYSPTISSVDYLAICTKNIAEFG